MAAGVYNRSGGGIEMERLQRQRNVPTPSQEEHSLYRPAWEGPDAVVWIGHGTYCVKTGGAELHHRHGGWFHRPSESGERRMYLELAYPEGDSGYFKLRHAGYYQPHDQHFPLRA